MKSIDENLVKMGKGDAFRPMFGAASGSCYRITPDSRRVRRKADRMLKSELRRQFKKQFKK